jgi:hypothetical protein
MDTHLVVISLLQADGERFVLVDADVRGDFAERFARAWTTEPAEERVRAFQQGWADFLTDHAAVTESDARLQLSHHGLVAEEIDEKIVKARHFREWAPQSLAEWTTAVGYRNAHDQVVIRRTDQPGLVSFQRVFELRCDVCGHTYGAHGCDIHACRCPACQNGSPGILVSTP